MLEHYSLFRSNSDKISKLGEHGGAIGVFVYDLSIFLFLNVMQFLFSF